MKDFVVRPTCSKPVRVKHWVYLFFFDAGSLQLFMELSVVEEFVGEVDEEKLG